MNDIFSTPSWLVLREIHDNTITIGCTEYCPLSQSEIAANLQFSTVYVNGIFSGLRNNGYIESMGRSKWKLTDKGFEAYRLMNEV